MPYQVNCPSCGQPHRLTDEHVGISVECTKCGRPFVYDEPIQKAKERQRQIKREAKEWERVRLRKIRQARRERGETIEARIKEWWQDGKDDRQCRHEQYAEAARKNCEEWEQRKRMLEHRIRIQPHKRMNGILEIAMGVCGWILVVVLTMTGVYYLAGPVFSNARSAIVGAAHLLCACTLATLMSIRRARVCNQYLLEAILEDIRIVRDHITRNTKGAGTSDAGAE